MDKTPLLASERNDIPPAKVKFNKQGSTLAEVVVPRLDNERLQSKALENFRRIADHHHQLNDKEHAMMEQYESLDYDTVENSLYRNFKANQSAKDKRWENIAGWVVYFFIGCICGVTAFLISISVEKLSEWRMGISERAVESGHKATGFLYFALTSIGFVGIATGLVNFVEPAAAGSGIPELKSYLNGTNLEGVLTFKALICKVVGVVFSVSGGLICGKEGPLVHTGAVLAVMFSHLPTLPTTLGIHQLRRFRNDHAKRDFVSGGAAAGVASAFGAPVGGVLFSLEEASSFWSLPLTWRVFFGAMCSTFTLNLCLSAYNGHALQINTPGLITFGSFANSAYALWEIPFFVGLAVFGGFMGALFNAINVKICHFRREYLTGRKYLKFVEAVSIGFLTATLLFWSPTWLAECMDELKVNTECTCFAEIPLGTLNHTDEYNCYTEDQVEDTSQCVDVDEEVERTSQYECGAGKYNNLASLSFQTEETAIKTFFHNTSTIGPKALMFYCFMLFFLAVITYGIAVPSGLFVPCILIGCSYGRMIGELVRNHIADSVNPGTYALIGAVSMLGGVTRMTISLTVIILETTNDIQYLLPIMITLMVAKWVGDYFNISLYDLHVELKCVPFVEAMPPVALEQLDARHVMMEPVITVNEVQSAYEVYKILVDCTHNGFPVVTEDEGLFRGIVLRNQIIILMQRRFFVELPELAEDEKDGKVSDDVSSSKSLSLSNAKPSSGANVIELENIDDIEHKRKMNYLKKTSHTEVNVSNLPFSWDDFYTSLESETLSLAELRYRKSDIEDLKGKYIDFRAVMNPSPFCVQVDTPLTRVFRLYRSMGIRHLPVVDLNNRCVGMLTRKELRTDFKVDLF